MMKNNSSKKLFLDLQVKLPDNIRPKRTSSMSINKEPSLNRKPSETQKEKQRKFEEIMKGGSQVQKELDGLNNRFDNGLGKGVSFYKAQLKK